MNNSHERLSNLEPTPVAGNGSVHLVWSSLCEGPEDFKKQAGACGGYNSSLSCPDSCSVNNTKMGKEYRPK